jgi:hypothetical protein
VDSTGSPKALLPSKNVTRQLSKSPIFTGFYLDTSCLDRHNDACFGSLNLSAGSLFRVPQKKFTFDCQETWKYFGLSEGEHNEVVRFELAPIFDPACSDTLVYRGSA